MKFEDLRKKAEKEGTNAELFKTFALLTLAMKYAAFMNIDDEDILNGTFDFDDKDFQNYIDESYSFNSIKWEDIDFEKEGFDADEFKKSDEDASIKIIKITNLMHRYAPDSDRKNLFDCINLDQEIIKMIEDIPDGKCKFTSKYKTSQISLAVSDLYAQIKIRSERLELFKKSAEILLDKLIEEDSTEGYYELGNLYMRGELSIPRLRMKAIACYTVAANRGYLPAMLELGKLYLEGKVIEKDVEAGVEYLQKAADGGNKTAMLELARYFKSAGDTKKALELIGQLKGKFDNPGLEFLEGQIYFENKKKEKGLLLILSAAEKECADAQYYLAKMYLDKPGKDASDKRRIINLLKRAADHNHLQALYELGMALIDDFYYVDEEKPYYITSDYISGVGYLTKAANLGHTGAQLQLADLYIGECVPFTSAHFLDAGMCIGMIRNEEVECDFKAARYWVEQAILGGDVRAYIQQAYMIATGMGYEKDTRYGIKQLKKYAKQGHESAVRYLKYFDPENQ